LIKENDEISYLIDNMKQVILYLHPFYLEYTRLTKFGTSTGVSYINLKYNNTVIKISFIIMDQASKNKLLRIISNWNEDIFELK
jgi:hypothetical protein